MSMTREEIIKQYEVAVEGGELIAPFMGEDEKELYEMLKAGLSALRPVSREQVEKVWRGEWISTGAISCKCSRCNHLELKARAAEYNFCPACNVAMTDEAVQMVMERLNKMEETKK